MSYLTFVFLQFAKSIISQAHLCPLPLHVCPVYWAYDRGMRLYPLPDVIVCADKFDPFNTSTADCTIMNPVSTVGGQVVQVIAYHAYAPKFDSQHRVFICLVIDRGWPQWNIISNTGHGSSSAFANAKPFK